MTEGTEIAVIPHTGEVISLDDPLACGHGIQELRLLEARVRDLKRELTNAIVQEARRQGTNTMHRDGWTVKVTPSDDLVWDMEILRELVEAGLPEERWNALVRVTVEHKVDAQEARQIARANQTYEEIIGRALTRTPRTPSVSVRRET